MRVSLTSSWVCAGETGETAQGVLVEGGSEEKEVKSQIHSK